MTTLFAMEEHPPIKLGTAFFVSDILRFELVPIIALLGHQYQNSISPQIKLKAFMNTYSTRKRLDIVLECFGYTGQHRESYLVEINRYIHHEASKIKRNPSLKRFPSNLFQPKELMNLLQDGAVCFTYQQGAIFPFLENLKSRIPEALPYVPKYSSLMRYLLNGLPDRYWYEETHHDVVKLLPDEDPRVVFDLLAATSIRSSIEANAKKFFLALHQYHQGVRTPITIRLGNAKKDIDSYFTGFMGTTIMHLNDIRNGSHLCENLDEDTARKIKNFAKAMMGDPDAVPVDIWLMRAFDTDIKANYKGKMMSRSPTAKLYDAIHEYFRIVAKSIGFETRQVSAMTWAGIRGEHSVSKTTRFAPLLEKRLDKGLFAA